MSENCLISFIIPYHNEPTDMLLECLRSITALDIKRTDYEIIVVDDGSDISPQKEINGEGIEVVYLYQECKGQGEARNYGIKHSNGRYIQFIDADDKLISSRYNEITDLIRTEEPDMVLLNHTTNKEKTKKGKRRNITSGAFYMTKNNIKSPVWSYVFKKEMADGLYFSLGTLTEDEEFTPLLMIRAKRLIDTDITAYFYRTRKESLTTTQDKEKKIKRLDDSEQTIIRLNNFRNNSKGTEQEAIGRRVSQLTMDYIYNICKFNESEKELETRVERLKKNNLFPLDLRYYTTKYFVFAIATRCKIGRKLLNLLFHCR